MEKYTIKSGNTSLCVDSLGAQVNSFKVDGKEHIWQRDEKYWGSSAPVLFPIVGELKGERKTTLIDGKRYHLKRHGFASVKEFKVTDKTEDSITLTIKSDEDTIKMYPYKFTFSVVYTVSEGKFTQSFVIENENDIDMPYVVGGHPGFILPMFKGDRFEDYELVFEKGESAEAMRINEQGLIDEKNNEQVFVEKNRIKVTHELFKLGAIIFERLNSRRVKLVNKSGKGIEVEFPKFDYLGVWQMAGTNAEYLCIEPWTGMNDTVDCDEVYKNKRGMRFIPPKSKTELSLSAKTI